jgi:site-specific DNA-cytosine methylase
MEIATLCLIELWSGVASLSTALCAQGASLHAYCESNPLLNTLLSQAHPGAQSASLSEKGEWKFWSLPKSAVVWVLGGPSCTSLSTAGKQLAGDDPTSRYLFDHIFMAAAFGASLILLENVLYLVEGDSVHGLYTQLLQQAAALGYVLVQQWKVEDAKVGGSTQRARLFLIWEKKSIHEKLPQWHSTVCDPVGQLPAPISASLLPVHLLPPSVWLQGVAVFDPDITIRSHQATKVGFIKLKGALESLKVGDLVGRKTTTKGVNRWRVMSLRGSQVELRRADRKQPDFALVARSELQYTLTEKIPLYHPDGIGVGLRRWGEPPLKSAFAIIQLTSVGWKPRILQPEECWALQGLSNTQLLQLQQLGATPEEVAAAAGNAITGAMAEAVTAALLPRFAQHYTVITTSRAVAYQVPINAQPTSLMKQVFFIPTALQPTPECLLLKSGSALSFMLPDPSRAHKSSSKLASEHASHVLGTEVQAILCGHFDDHTLVYVIPYEEQVSDPNLLWHKVEEVEQQQVRLMMSLAICTSFSFAPPPCELAFIKDRLDLDSEWSEAQRTVISMAVHLGARLPKRVVSKHLPSGGSESLFSAAVERDALAAAMLKAAIHAHAPSVTSDLRASYLAWADCIKPLPVADIPAQLYQEMDDFADPELAKIQIPVPCPTPTTTWLPRKIQPIPPEGFHPKVLADLLTSEAIKLMEDWLLQQMLYLTDIEANGAAARRTTNKPLALGLDMFRPEARGIVWDLRRMDEGLIEPVDFEQPIQSHLNLQQLQEELSDWPDQELLSFLLLGVRYKADIDYQIVLLPHLVSLRDGYASLLDEVAKYTDAGWYGLFSYPPFLPFRAVPKGSVPRKLEPLRPRPTTEAGAPRKLLNDTLGRPVLSINEASSGKTPQAIAELSTSPVSRADSAKWPKENKPTIADVLTVLALFSHVAGLLGEAVYTAADDFKNFFNQLRLAPEEFWKCGMIISKLGQPMYAAEYIMTFGLRPASNIAQRFADAILSIWKKRMQALEEPFTAALAASNPVFRAWVQSRGGIAAATAALFAAFIYTDDPIFIIIGAERMARGLHCWTQLCAELGLLMAIPAKRQCGTHVEWLGAGIAAMLGIAWIPRHKVTSALSKIESVVQARCTVGDYHSLLGLLEHLVFINGMRRNIMYYLWSPFQQKVALEPNRILMPSGKMQTQLKRWKALLISTPGVSALRMVSQATIPAGCITLTAYSDAMREPGHSGMGGWMHGIYWSQQLVAPFTSIPIAVLEFVAALTSILTFASLLPEPSDSASMILHVRVDALSTPFILTEDAASSPTMIAVHSYILNHPLFMMWAPCIVVSHVPGVGNEFSDAASRDEIWRLNLMAAHMRISPSSHTVHPDVQHLLQAALANPA